MRAMLHQVFNLQRAYRFATAAAMAAILGAGALPVAHWLPVVGGQAALADSYGCPSSWACMWVNVGPGGQMGQFQGNNSFWGDFAQPGCGNNYPLNTWNDCASAVDNAGTQCTVHYYQNINYNTGPNNSGWRLDVALGAVYTNLTTIQEPGTGTANDAISSNNWC